MKTSVKYLLNRVVVVYVGNLTNEAGHSNLMYHHTNWLPHVDSKVVNQVVASCDIQHLTMTVTDMYVTNLVGNQV